MIESKLKAKMQPLTAVSTLLGSISRKYMAVTMLKLNSIQQPGSTKIYRPGKTNY